MLGHPRSKFEIPLSDLTLSYFNKFNWSLVRRGLGKSWKNEADTFANVKGIGNNNLFLSILFKSFSIINLVVPSKKS